MYLGIDLGTSSMKCLLIGEEQELIKSINYRLISDVPLGTYLSGGVDSSLITSITSINTNKKINTYTIGFKDWQCLPIRGFPCQNIVKVYSLGGLPGPGRLGNLTFCFLFDNIP